jgi:hypothetical protein
MGTPTQIFTDPSGGATERRPRVANPTINDLYDIAYDNYEALMEIRVLK